MGFKTTISDVFETVDGRRGKVRNTKVTAREIAALLEKKFINYDPDRQRGRSQVTQKVVVDEEKVERWARDLVSGQAYLGQLTWNVRPEAGRLEFNPETHTLEIDAVEVFLPDSRHRHLAIKKAVEAADRGSSFDTDQPFSVAIYNIPKDQEPELFYWRNQQGQKADEARSKWLYQVGPNKIAGELVRTCKALKDNVDTVSDRLSRKNYRLASFNTLAIGFERHWAIKEADSPRAIEWLVRYWDKLTEVRPELGVLDIVDRRKVREDLLIDSAVSIIGFIGLARRMYDAGTPLTALSKLRATYADGKKTGDFFAKDNPKWQAVGIMVPRKSDKTGTVTLNMRNAQQSRAAMLNVLTELVVAQPVAAAKPREAAPVA